VDGSEWNVTNGLAQGCPASPDLLNILFEVFHRWAAAQEKGVNLHGGAFLASTSFADDVVLVATSWEEMEFLITAFLQWCRLLGLKVNVPKTQLWSSKDAGRTVTTAVNGVTASFTTHDTFRVVGVELGLEETKTTRKHFEPRIAKAVATGKRLAALPVPAAIAAQLWRSTVLAQALYGCEVRQIGDDLLRPLRSHGRLMLAQKAPLAISCYGALEAITGPPLGACAMRHPQLEVLSRQLRWVVTLANSPGHVGSLHRELAMCGDAPWKDSTPALAKALKKVGWTLVRNAACVRATRWPVLDPEPSYGGVVVLRPHPHAPVPPDTVWTDGSLGSAGGGAAALQPSTSTSYSCRVPGAASSPECELVALTLVAQFGAAPPLVLTLSPWWPCS